MNLDSWSREDSWQQHRFSTSIEHAAAQEQEMRSSAMAVAVEPGDVVVMHPQLGHSGGLKRGPSIRMAVYFRLLASDADAWRT